ncbi:MAG: isoleucine--tRNA ligase [Candidatus Burarchaeum sp.]|nr:isoleucine--tRNA ligase [Candidatus Burarchaeum sp.]MDO8339420.1 isoleucine--tRNA ligase [Candidatus Burarchaeum sp.]
MYDALETEKKILKLWESERIYEKVKEKNAKGEKLYFCDGPPYATGQIHPGTAWNKCIKDAMCRYWRARGRNLRAKPGYDTHGLPIEVKVEQELKLRSKKEIEEKIGVAEFIRKCKQFATQYVGVMGGQFQRCGVWMDWADPYITYRDAYIERSWATIRKAHEKGLLHRGIYVLPLCPRCETTMANYELEYEDADDPSIYVKFELKKKEKIGEKEFLIIWTTTPWTLVANMAVMVHPEFKYVKAKVGEEVWIVAKERLDALIAVTHELGLSPIILGEVAGKKLEGLEYAHPLAEKVPKQKSGMHKVVLSDEFVTLEDGTGLVHCAPGHGPQDFIVGKRYGLEIFCPVGPNGNYTAEAGEYAGMNVKKASHEILEYLKERGTLIHAGKIRHRYAHCWRCKTPLIYITTDQWFITVSKIKEEMLKEIDRIRWQPEHARTWFRDFVGNAPDWCISRQRYWGIPLPIWICTNDKCKEIKVVGSASELPQKLDDLHKPGIDAVEFPCAKCKGTMKRTPDVLDVWFDSGNAVWAGLTEEEEKRWYPCDFITEGKDQVRGWFYSLLGSGVVLKDEIPYKSILMHGFFMDEKGEKMSKSLGNFVPLEEMLDKHGADAFRLWSLSSRVWEDLRFNWNEMKEAAGVVGIMSNLCVYMERFYTAGKAKGKPAYKIEDAWLLSRLNSVTKEATQAFDDYRIHDAVNALKKFVVEDLSRFYLKIAKARMGGEQGSADAEAVNDVLYQSMLAVVKLMTPITPFVCEDIYQKFFRQREKEVGASLLGWPSYNEKEIDVLLEGQMKAAEQIITAAANARQAAGVKLRWPISEVVVESESSEVSASVERLGPVIAQLANAKAVRMGKALEGYASADFEGGKAWINPKLDDALYSEAMARELVRRVQATRKEMELLEKDEVKVHVHAPKEFVAIVKPHAGLIASSVNAKKLELKEKEKESAAKSDGKMWKIEEWEVHIKVEKT